MAEENGLDVDKKMDGASTSKALETERSSGLNGSREEPEKSKGDEKAKTVPFLKLFSFADSTDIILMILGTVGAIGNGASTPIMTLILGQVINTFGKKQTGDIVNTVTKVCLKYVYLALGAGAAALLQTACWTITGERQAARIRGFYLKAILRQDLTFFDKETNTGEVIGRMSGDTVLIQDAMGEKVGKFLQLIATFIGGFIIAFVKGWLLTLVMMSAIPLLVLAGGIMSILITKSASRGQRAYAEASTVVEQTISSIRTVASFTGEKRAINSYNKFLLTAYKSGVHEGLAVGMGLGTYMLVVFCTYAMAVWFGGKMVLKKGYNGGEVINVIIAVLTASMSLGQTSPCMSAFSVGQAVAYKMFETINRKPKIDPYNTNGRTMDDIRGDIELRDIYFNYPARPEEQILCGFSLSIPSGTTAALVGHSGSGKSTVISLIERFYDPLAGEVLIDGINLKEFQLKWIRRKIGLVSQEPVLFTSCIKDNIAYGKDEATVEEIKAAAELANAATFIDELPEGLDTMVGEHGTRLSGGQKQRIAIARAILKDPRILLLDEATSALDVESERTVQEALEKIMVNRTTVMVVHRLTTIRNADIIAVIHQGKIVEKGSHSELLEDPNGAYSQLIRLQDSNKESEKVAEEDYSNSEFTVEAFRLSSQRKSMPRPFSHASSRNSSRHCNNSEFTVEAFRQSSQRKSMPRSFSRESSRNSSRDSLSLAFGLPIGLDAPDDHLEDLETFPPSEDAPDVSIRRLASLNKPELPILVLGTIAASISGAILPIYGILISRTIKSFFDQPHVLRKELNLWALMYMTLGIAAFVLYPIRTYLFSVAGSKLIQRIRSMCFEKVVNMEISWFDKPEHSSGVIGARLSADAAAVRALVGDALAQNVQNIATALAGIIIAFTASWQLAFIVLGIVPLIAINGFVQLKFIKGFSEDAKVVMYGEASQVVNDAVSSIRTVASFCAEEKVAQLYEMKCEGPMKTGVRIGLISGIGFGLSSSFLYSFYAASFYAGARLVQSGHITFEDVFQVLFALTMAATGITNSSNFAPDSAKSKDAAASVFSFIDCKSKIDPSDESGMTLESVKGDIEFRHVSFNYPLRPDIQIFRDFNLTIHAGKTVALVGESGSGKSTVIALLQRFYDPDSGTISLDGTEIRRLQLRWLRQQMALVSQEPALFNDTIRANIAYGKGGNASEAEIIAAAELANAHKFLSSLEQGYDTVVGERGVQLSGGQKQRVAIACAIIKSPKILLLDEATSALDVESERVVQDALDRIMEKRTTVVVAHRLSTIRNADLIAVVKNGFIAEKGRHETLINIKDGVYASLVALHTNAKTV